LLNFFKKKKSNKTLIQESKITENIKIVKEEIFENESIKVINIPKICCLDILDKDIQLLEKNGFNITSGTLGKKVNVPNKQQREYHKVLPNSNIPNNLHEYEITILDLNNSSVIDYDIKNHTKIEHTGTDSVSLSSEYPETIFNPQPFGSNLLQNRLNQLNDKEHLIITFTTASYSVNYQFLHTQNDKVTYGKNIEYKIYDFCWTPLLKEKKGERIIVVSEMNKKLKEFLSKYVNQMSYNQTFYHPTDYNNKKDDNYFPLLENTNGDIVSMIASINNKTIFYFPQIKDKAGFLNEFLSEIAPSMFPDLFPYSTTHNWKKEEDYWLPNHEQLIKSKKLLIKEYEHKLKTIDTQIKKNEEKFSFLHLILMETGDNLVANIMKYLKWLGFENITDMDETKNENMIFEEDIQIDIDKGLLIIECKGIGGTSKDYECSQISKIKHRRCEERDKFDVFALYIVNHQRHKAPLARENPPFTKEQINDALNEKRGLLTTWQLYNLYFDIEKEILTKKEAREVLLEYGLIEFKPKNLIFVDEPKKFYQNNIICSVNIEDIALKVNDILFIERNNKFSKVTILDIQENGKSFKSVNNGKFGLKLDKPIKRNSKIWKKLI